MSLKLWLWSPKSEIIESEWEVGVEKTGLLESGVGVGRPETLELKSAVGDEKTETRATGNVYHSA